MSNPMVGMSLREVVGDKPMIASTGVSFSAGVMEASGHNVTTAPNSPSNTPGSDIASLALTNQAKPVYSPS